MINDLSTSSSFEPVKPAALKVGDTVGLIAPSSPIFEPADIEFTYKWLKKLGLKYKVGKYLFESLGDCAGSPESRLEDWHQLWADKQVKAILPIRGGNGAVQLLEGIDFQLIKNNPKIFVGYSDITGLLIPIHQATGLITFHGPTAGSFFKSSYTYQNYVRLLMEPKALGPVCDPECADNWKPAYPPTRVVLSPGTGQGRLIGGCMTLIRQLAGTRYELETKDKIVFLEDVHEEPHCIDRILNQLILSGKLIDAAGIVIGECASCRPGQSGRNALELSLSLEHMLRETLGGLGIPVVYGFRFGHGGEQLTIPLGIRATLSAYDDAVSLTFDESATS